jgi:hypothetical protein
MVMPEKQSSQSRKGSKNQTTSAHKKERYAFYKSNSYAKNKLTRILQSCGVAFAKSWARTHMGETALQRLLKGREDA